MGGICGWVAAARKGAPRAAGPGVAAMAAALAHRGGVAVLEAASGAGSPGHVVADASLMPHDAIAVSWRARPDNPEAFARSLEGAFAVAAHDAARDRLVLVRDRLGERPLYWCATPEGVAFATEIKALRAAGLPSDRALRPEAIDAYFAFTCIPAPWTIFEHVGKVPAGHAVVFDLAAAQPGRAPSPRFVRYWSLPESRGLRATPEEMIARLDDAIGRRLPADGDVACFLSGGLDSSLVAALAARRTGSPPILFTCGFTAPGLDETRHAARVAERIGGDHRVIRLDAIDAVTAQRVVAMLDEPMADAATLPTWVLAREASKVARVILTGDGADALLAGDHWFRRLHRVGGLERIPAPLRAPLPALAGLLGRKRYRRWRDLVDLARLDPAAAYLTIRQKWTPEGRHTIYSADFASTVDPDRTAAVYTSAPVGWRRLPSVDAAIRLDASFHLPEGLLMKGDKMCGAHGCESRSPFPDREFAEWAASLATDLHLRGASSKDLLKRAAEAVLPKELIWRRKRGFRTPMRGWLKGPLAGLVQEAFDADRIRRQGIFDAAALAGLRGGFDAGPGSAALDGRMWQVVVFQTWWRQVFEGA